MAVAARPSEAFRVNMRETRTARGWSQQQLADRAGMDQAAISRMEQEPTRRITVDEAFDVAAALGCSPAFLFVPRSSTARMSILGRSEKAPKVRAWLRGASLQEADTMFNASRMPPEEFLRLFPNEVSYEAGQIAPKED